MLTSKPLPQQCNYKEFTEYFTELEGLPCVWMDADSEKEWQEQIDEQMPEAFQYFRWKPKMFVYLQKHFALLTLPEETQEELWKNLVGHCAHDFRPDLWPYIKIDFATGEMEYPTRRSP